MSSFPSSSATISGYADVGLERLNGRLVSQEGFLSRLPERLLQILQTHDQAVLLISGPSGAGKTTLAETAQAQCSGIPSVVLDMDRFFKETRQERQNMVVNPGTTPEYWWRNVYDWDQVERVFGRLREMGQNGGVLNQERVYQNGTFLTNDEAVRMPVPPGKKVVIAPGHEVYLAVKHAGYSESAILRATVIRDLRASLEAALIRDFIDGKVQEDPEEVGHRLYFRAREYGLQRRVYSDVLGQESVTVVDNRHLRPHWDRTLPTQRKLLRGALRAFDAPSL